MEIIFTLIGNLLMEKGDFLTLLIVPFTAFPAMGKDTLLLGELF